MGGGEGGGLRIFIVDDHEIFRDGLRTIIESSGHARVVAEASTVREAYQLLETVEFDMLVVDISMPGVNGISLIRELRRRKNRQPILVLTMYSGAEMAVEAFAAGATGFALKSDSRVQILEAVSSVGRGERFVAESLPLETIEAFLAKRPRSTSASGPLELLTVREREVFDLLMRGYDNQAIAAELCVSLKTVDSHRTKTFSKLRVHSIGELLRFGFRHRLLYETSS